MKNLLFIVFVLVTDCSFARQSMNFPDPHVSFVKRTVAITPDSYKICSFQVSVLPKRGDLRGPYSYYSKRIDVGNSDALNAMQFAKPGETVFIEEIKVKGPDGRVLTVSPMKIVIQ